MDSENIEDAIVGDKTNVIPDSEFQVNQFSSADLYHPEQIQILPSIREDLEKRQQICVTSLSCVTDSIRSTVKEQVAKFLHIIGHNVKTRTMSFFFHRLEETISRHFHNVLHAILSLEGEFFKQPY
ncbi:hypothetical protein S83_002910, partial [Arachis hypogaea]